MYSSVALRLVIGSGLLLVGCDASEPTPGAPAPPVSTRDSTTLTTQEVEDARRHCERAGALVREGRLSDAEEELHLAGAAFGPRRLPASSEDLVACVYLTEGLLGEARFDVAMARGRYERALEIRDDPVVRERLARLGTRDVEVPVQRFGTIEAQLRAAEDHPCGTDADQCTIAFTTARRSGGGSSLEAAAVLVEREQDTVEPYRGELYIVFPAADGTYRWGPKLWPRYARDEWSAPVVQMDFLPVRDAPSWLLFIRMDASWERCEGLVSGDDSSVAVCEIGEGARCIFITAEHGCEDDGYVDRCEGCEDPEMVAVRRRCQRCSGIRRRYVTFDSAGMTVRDADEARGDRIRGDLSAGVHPWPALFPGSAAQPSTTRVR